jgi:hypothetical protein
MAKIIQTNTVKMLEEGERKEALEAMKRYKKFMEGKGASVSVAFAIEAGPAAGYTTVATTFPSAAAWAALVDDEGPELTEVRNRFLKAKNIVSTSLMQVIDL